MSSYQDLHWGSLNFVKAHLYRRIATPLNEALARLAVAIQTNDLDTAKDQLQHVGHSLELTLNLIKAWAALIYVQNGGVIPDYQRRQIAPDALPEWVVSYLDAQTTFRSEHTQSIFVHPETFYESLILLRQVGSLAGELKHLVISDAQGARTGVCIRAVFEPPPSGPFASLNGLIAGLDPGSPSDQEMATHLQVMGGFFKINDVRLVLQNNTQTGEQALTALLPVTPASTSFPSGLAHKASSTGTERASMPKTDALPPSESPDRLPSRERGAERANDLQDEPHLTGPTLAPTPHALAQPAASPMQPGGQPASLAGPVLAPMPRRVAPAEEQATLPPEPER